MRCRKSVPQVSNFGRLSIEFCKAAGRARMHAGVEYWRVRRRILEREEGSDFGWWCALEMRKCVEEARLVWLV